MTDLMEIVHGNRYDGVTFGPFVPNAATMLDPARDLVWNLPDPTGTHVVKRSTVTASSWSLEEHDGKLLVRIRNSPTSGVREFLVPVEQFEYIEG
jgi:hypothetical protein